MTRESALDKLLEARSRNILCEMVTGYGKTSLAIKLVRSRVEADNINSLLIVVPRNVLKDNWKKELKKWWPDYDIFVEFTTYVSLPKYTDNWDAVIFDECHHLSERCLEALKDFNIDNAILLSATVNKDLKKRLFYEFPDLYCLKVDMQEAIKYNVIPEPRIILLELNLDNDKNNYYYDLNPSSRLSKIITPYSNRYKLTKEDKKKHYVLECTQLQYYNEMSHKISFYKNRSGVAFMRNRYLRLSGERLKWLSKEKENIIRQIQEKTKDYRSLTFCSSIEQTNRLGEHCINSENKDSKIILDKFNNGEIDHITAVDMLNEGMNLSNCKLGIFAVINSSNTLIVQKLGRILRHEKPVIIIPYYYATREEEIVKKTLEEYDQRLITKVKSVDEIII